jgi:hypothetical protein
MAAFDYVNAHAVAVKLITKFGQPADIIKKGNAGGYDTSGNVIAPQPDVTISGIVTPLLQYKQSEIDGENVQSGDSYVFFESATLPEIGYMITVNAIEFRVIDLTNLTSVDNIKIYLKIQLRR